MKIVITNTSIDIYGIPTVEKLVEILNQIQQQYPGVYDKYHVCTGLMDAINKGILELISDSRSDILDLSKDYFLGCDPKEVNSRIIQN